jgi:NAD(P)-dependent dehydrogenase (short-subunit alcohol dehydrogenase family)
LRLDGKAGVVTGAGRGIGRVLALELARRGAALVVNDAGVAVDGGATGERPAEAVVGEIRAQAGRAVADTGSVASWGAAHEMVAAALREFGRLDFVVNNAGVVRDAIFHKLSEADWDAVVAVHLKGAFNVSRAAAERFRAQGSGAIVNMTSTSGLIGNLGQASYAAAKLGIVALTRSIALDMRRFGVRANAVAPFAWTRITETIPEGSGEAERRRISGLKALAPEQVAPLVVYLVSDASADVSGQVFAVRGAEIFVFSHARPLRSVRCASGFTPELVAEKAMPELRQAFTPLQVTADVFPDDPFLG